MTMQKEPQPFPVSSKRFNKGDFIRIHTDERLEVFEAEWDIKNLKSAFVEKLSQTTIRNALSDWLRNLNAGTSKNYAYYASDMMRRGIIPDVDQNGNPITVWHFNQVPHEMVIDRIKKVEDWSEGTRQVRCACYISFTAYLERISQGWFRKAIPSTLASNPTFFQVRDKCTTKTLTLLEWHRFITALHDINRRDALIARCMLQGAKRVSEALDLVLQQLDFDKSIIRFIQKKTGGTIKEIPISYPQHFMDELKDYIECTKDVRKDSQYIFITGKGRKLTRSRFNYSFAKASEVAQLKKVTPHMLRATWVTLAKTQEVSDSEIMKVTGHTSAKMVYAYDKTSAEDNYSRKLVLV